MSICPSCFYQQLAHRARTRAQSWDEQHLLSIGGPHLKVAAEFDALATGAGACRCDDPQAWTCWVPKPRKKDDLL